MSQNGPHSTCRLVGAGLVRPRSQACSFFFFFFQFYQFIATNPSPSTLMHTYCHVTPWTAARQAPLSMDFSRQEYWNGLPFPSPPGLLFEARSSPLVADVAPKLSHQNVQSEDQQQVTSLHLSQNSSLLI